MTSSNRYLVGYMSSDGRVGSADISLELPVRGMKDVDVLAQLLRDQGVAHPIVLSFSRFEEN